jgi:hypothetical protein
VTIEYDDTLHLWVQKQRALKRNNKLPPDRGDLLEALNFEWNPTSRFHTHLARANKPKSPPVPWDQVNRELMWTKEDVTWMKIYHQYKEHMAGHGLSYPPMGTSLREWIRTQEEKKKNNKLLEYRETLLVDLGLDLKTDKRLRKIRAAVEDKEESDEELDVDVPKMKNKKKSRKRKRPQVPDTVPSAPAQGNANRATRNVAYKLSYNYDSDVDE